MISDPALKLDNLEKSTPIARKTISERVPSKLTGKQRLQVELLRLGSLIPLGRAKHWVTNMALRLLEQASKESQPAVTASIKSSIQAGKLPLDTEQRQRFEALISPTSDGRQPPASHSAKPEIELHQLPENTENHRDAMTEDDLDDENYLANQDARLEFVDDSQPDEDESVNLSTQQSGDLQQSVNLGKLEPIMIAWENEEHLSALQDMNALFSNAVGSFSSSKVENFARKHNLDADSIIDSYSQLMGETVENYELSKVQVNTMRKTAQAMNKAFPDNITVQDLLASINDYLDEI